MTFQDNDIKLLGTDDMAGWMLMRKAGLCCERRERLITFSCETLFCETLS